MRAVMPTAVIASSAGLLLGGCYESTPRVEERRVFQLHHAHALDVDVHTEFGDVDIAPTGTPLPKWAAGIGNPTGAPDEVFVVAVVGSRDAERLPFARAEPEINGSTLLLREEWPPTSKKNLNEGTRWAVRVPAVGAVDVYTDFGDVDIRGASGPASIESDYGDLALLEHAGSIEADTDFGDVQAELGHGHTGPLVIESGYRDITLENPEVPATIKTDFGDIRVHNAAEALDLNTDYGAINAVFTPDSAGPITAYSDFGTVSVTLGRNFTGTLEAETDFGSIKTRGHVPANAVVRGKKDYRFLQFGPSLEGPESSLASDYGDVIVEFPE